MIVSPKEHWNQVYKTKAPTAWSWFQSSPAISLRLIAAAGGARGVIDVGGGASTLVDGLLDAGFATVAVLDVSAALAQARQRLGSRGGAVEWFEADVTAFDPPHRFDVWHDRAVFHFLTAAADRARYVQSLRRALAPGGGVIIATFAMGGPLQCSGLEVVRYDAAAISAELGSEFQLLEQVDEPHHTPWDSTQQFSYFRFQRQCRAALNSAGR